ncbi:hypothetical protein DFH29DRAFT_948232 [Suillus ampliporus]|nr:hypothetical protein DFH29DRAFT_948232 [Suillus ampliporus]
MQDTQLGARGLCNFAVHFCQSRFLPDPLQSWHILLSSLPLVTKLLPPPPLAGYRHAPVEFQKDDDTNHYFDIVTAASCNELRHCCGRS